MVSRITIPADIYWIDREVDYLANLVYGSEPMAFENVGRQD